MEITSRADLADLFFSLHEEFYPEEPGKRENISRAKVEADAADILSLGLPGETIERIMRRDIARRPALNYAPPYSIRYCIGSLQAAAKIASGEGAYHPSAKKKTRPSDFNPATHRIGDGNEWFTDEEIKWRVRMRAYVRDTFWHFDTSGPPPLAKGCRVPRPFIEALDAGFQGF